MTILTAESVSTLSQFQVMLLVFAVAIGIATAAIYLMIFLFGMSVSINCKKTVLSLLLMFILPVTLIGFTMRSNVYTQAEKKIAVYQLVHERIGEGYAVAFVTQSSAVAYLEYYDYQTKKTKPILPENGLRPTNYHEFLFQPSAEGGEFTFIIDSETFKIDGKPIIIAPK